MERTRTVLALVAAIVLASALGGCQTPQEKFRSQGLALYNKGDTDGALLYFNKALQYDEFDARSNYYAGSIFAKQEKYAQAEYHYKLAWQADPSLPEVKDALTEVLLRQAKTDAALDFLERDAALTAKVKDPSFYKTVVNRPYQKQVEEHMFLGRAEDRFRIARTYEKLGDLENASTNYQKAITMAPRNTTYKVAAAEFYTKLGNRAAATTALMQAYDEDPKTPGLAELMSKNGINLPSATQP